MSDKISEISRRTALKTSLTSVGAASGVFGFSSLVEAKSNEDYVIKSPKKEHQKEIQSYTAFKNCVEAIEEENESLNLDGSKLLVPKESLLGEDDSPNIDYRISIPYASVDEFEPVSSGQALHVEVTESQLVYIFKLGGELYFASAQKRGVFTAQGPLPIPGFSVKKVHKDDLCEEFKLPYEGTMCIGAVGGGVISAFKGMDPTKIIATVVSICGAKDVLCSKMPMLIEEAFGDGPDAVCDSDYYFVYRSGDLVTSLQGYPVRVFCPLCKM